MLISEKIQENVQRLPEIFQVEVLDFVEYLLTKSEREAMRQDNLEWSDFSLVSAMRGMEDEDVPLYSVADIKVVFS